MKVKKILRKAILKVKCQHTRMLCVSLYCVLTTGCGKKIQNAQSDSEKTKEPLYTHSYSLKAKLFKNGDSIIDGKILDTNALVKIPANLEVIEGNAGNQEAKIHFELAGASELFCVYKGGSKDRNPITNDDIKKGLTYKFQACFEDIDNDGEPEEINYQPGQEIPFDVGTEVILEVVGADDREDNLTQADIDVEYL